MRLFNFAINLFFIHSMTQSIFTVKSQNIPQKITLRIIMVFPFSALVYLRSSADELV